MSKEEEALVLLKKITRWYTDTNNKKGIEASIKPYWGAPDNKTIEEAWKKAAKLTGLIE